MLTHNMLFCFFLACYLPSTKQHSDQVKAFSHQCDATTTMPTGPDEDHPWWKLDKGKKVATWHRLQDIVFFIVTQLLCYLKSYKIQIGCTYVCCDGTLRIISPMLNKYQDFTGPTYISTGENMMSLSEYFSHTQMLCSSVHSLIRTH